MGAPTKCAAICMQGELVTLIKGNTFQLSVAASRYTQLSDKPQENCENANGICLNTHSSLVPASERLAGSNLEGKEEDGGRRRTL